MNSDHERLEPRRPLRYIDVTLIDGAWGWEGYTSPDGSGASEDSADIQLDAEDDPLDPPHESLTLGVGLGVSNPLDRGCKLVVHGQDGRTSTYRWEGAPNDALANAWRGASSA